MIYWNQHSVYLLCPTATVKHKKNWRERVLVESYSMVRHCQSTNSILLQLITKASQAMKSTLFTICNSTCSCTLILMWCSIVYSLACGPSECDNQNTGCLEKPSVPCSKQHGWSWWNSLCYHIKSCIDWWSNQKTHKKSARH